MCFTKYLIFLLIFWVNSSYGQEDRYSKTRFLFMPGIDLTSISYREDKAPSYSALAATAKLNIQDQLSRRWEWSLSGYYTAFTFKKNNPATATFYGYNLRVGFAPKISKKWRFTISTGGYYTGMLVSNNTFGYSDLAGPQVYLTLKVRFSRKTAFGIYGKYSLISDGKTLLDSTNREVAGGANLGIDLTSRNLFSINTHYSMLEFKIKTIKIKSTTMSVGFSIGF